MSQLSIPQGATTTDLGGKYVIPGLIDLHTHISVTKDYVLDESAFTIENVLAELKTYASYGVTSVMSLGTEKDIVFDIIRNQRTGVLSEARIFTAGQGIVLEGGYGGVAGINTPVDTVEEAIKEVEKQISNGVDFVKIWVDNNYGSMDVLPEDISAAAIETAHRLGKRVLVHVFRLDDAKRVARQGADGFVHSIRDSEIDQELLDLMRENNIWQVSSTLSRDRSMFIYGDPAPFLNDQFFYKSIPRTILDFLRSEEFQKQALEAPQYRTYPSYFEISKKNLSMLAKEGVRYAFGTDSGPPGRFPGYFAHWELELMVNDVGFTPLEALRAATAYAGEFLNADIGVLAPGKWADFVVLDGNPAADIRNTRKINAVYIAGYKVN